MPDVMSPRVLTTQHHAAEWIRRAIASGELRPGDRVGQDAVAERVGVSVIPVREALNVLATEGLVSYRPRRGFVVTELNLADLEENYAIRRLLESEAVRRGVPRADVVDRDRIADLSAACTAAGRAGDISAKLAANRQFHFAIYELAGSRQLLGLIARLWDATEGYRALYYDLPGEGDAADSTHDEIVGAVGRNDVRATITLLDAHRARALDRMRGLLR